MALGRNCFGKEADGRMGGARRNNASRNEKIIESLGPGKIGREGEEKWRVSREVRKREKVEAKSR